MVGIVEARSPVRFGWRGSPHYASYLRRVSVKNSPSAFQHSLACINIPSSGFFLSCDKAVFHQRPCVHHNYAQ